MHPTALGYALKWRNAWIQLYSPGRGGGGSTPYNGLNGEAPSERGIFYSQSPLIPDTEGVIESVRIKWVGLRENVRAFFSPGTKQTAVRNNEV